ncbi:helix-turn-helix domain-containing protein [Herbidospora sp. NEAU-GS84]|uniref:Helix-turn-helix domain-containing protein n=1 Tax=Herbidospora solisilvae TaxID=2696284 RepID=A0A7C9JA14_9ACTN|nr:helix-turn-helix transcriptional regulator [Herbidospora solisilvae]NAS24308.1 helix-turn-helix domain-containing protein [Herbidospora solisilvae]
MDNGSNNLLGDFLRARRESTSPAQAGFLHAPSRRTPGLRREEVAMLAGVSGSYYIRLEQGRERNPSAQVLSALARVLRLDPDATEYLYSLAHPWARPQVETGVMDQVSPSLLRLVNLSRHAPALVLGRRFEVLAHNPLLEALYEGMTHIDHCVRMIYLSPAAVDFYPDWEKAARAKTAQLRTAVAADPDDPYLRGLVAELTAQSAEFRRIWALHEVRARGNEIKELRHPRLGDLSLSWEVLSVSGTGQKFVSLAAEPGSHSEWALRELAESVGASAARG